jgi:hypothetical protein
MVANAAVALDETTAAAAVHEARIETELGMRIADSLGHGPTHSPTLPCERQHFRTRRHDP